MVGGTDDSGGGASVLGLDRGGSELLGRTAPCFEVADGGGFGLRWGVCGRGGHCGSGRVDKDGFRELGIE